MVLVLYAVFLISLTGLFTGERARGHTRSKFSRTEFSLATLLYYNRCIYNTLLYPIIQYIINL